MKTPTLKEMKEFLRIDGSADDALVQSILLSAKDFVLSYTGRSSIDVERLKIALELVVAGLWERRDSLVEGYKITLNPILKMLLDSCKVDHSCA